MSNPINERLLDEKLSALEAARPWSPRVVSKLEATIRGADDYDLFRIDALRFAAEKSLSEQESIELFLHAAKLGLFEMNWHMVCAYCGLVVESLRELRSVHPHFACSFCAAENQASLDDYIHVSFTISPQVRDIVFLHPDSLSVEDFHLRYLFSRGVLFAGGATLAQVGAALTRFMAYLSPSEQHNIELSLDTGVVHAKNMKAKSSLVLFPQAARHADASTRIPILMADNSLRVLGVEVAPRDVVNGPALFKYPRTAEVSTGRVVVAVENGTAETSPLWLLQYPAGFAAAPVQFESFLSGKRLLTNHTFRSLFRSESVAEDESIGVKEIAFLFTDLKGSTAMYDHVGDPKAYYLVRQHFETLGKVVARHSGAIVKTIGDAIMATFSSPADALGAALEMIRELAAFSRTISEDLKLKVGIHVGHSIAVTLNERLDYFGQTVNIAARVQGLADGDEIYLTHDAYDAPGMSELLLGQRVEPLEVSVKGVRERLQVYKVTP
jgi:class 3 adenylate cyclase